MVVVPSIKLNNGTEMPVLGLGTYLSKPSEVDNAVRHAIGQGYRHIDTAFYYENEKEVGTAIKAKISEGVVKREDIYLVTKLWSHHHGKVEYACRKSLENLGLDYIDLYLIHCPVGLEYIDDKTMLPKGDDGQLKFTEHDYLDTWKEMEKLVKKGLVRSIGISNFNSVQTERIVKNCEIKPVTNQVECHVEFNQKKLIEFSKKFDIVITAYCPLAHPKPEEKKPAFLYDDKFKAIADKYNKTSAQIAIRYLIQIGTVPIPKSVTNSRIEENINVFDFKLSAADMKVLDSYDTGKRNVKFEFADKNKYYPFGIEF